MNITFFIGNGFDINVGLNTRYSNFYPYFMKRASSDNMIRQWLEADELQWADLEEKLGQQLVHLKEQEIEKWYDDKTELDGLLLDYLEQEQNRVKTIGNEEKISEEFVRSLMNFENELSEQDKISIHQTYATYRSRQFVYQFVSFNYTDVFDRFLRICRYRNLEIPIVLNDGVVSGSIGEVFHIHGTIEKEAILGVNDRGQIDNDWLKQNEEFQDTFIKKRMNEGIGQRKTEHVRQIIEQSCIICIFGMSLGSTDNMWWKELMSWLKDNVNNKLIICYKGYEEQLHKKIPSTIIRLNNELKRNIMEKGDVDYQGEIGKEIAKRIFISYNTNIFNFRDVV